MSIKFRRLSMSVAWMTVVTWLLPVQVAISDNGPTAKETATPVVRDVRLDQNDLLQGRLVNLEGKPVAGKQLHLWQADRTIAQTTSLEDGRFAFRQVPAGVYQIRFDEYAVACRVWTAKAAPPIAKEQLVVLATAPIVRGQQPIQALWYNPLVYGTLIGAAIAVPIIIHNNNDDKPAGS